MVSANAEIDLGSWCVSEAAVRCYLHAVGDSQLSGLGYGIAPPLALVAQALGKLLEKLALPPGAIHSMQEMETLKPVPVGERISAVAAMERPRRRGNLQFITVSYNLINGAGEIVITGKSTVLDAGST